MTSVHMATAAETMATRGGLSDRGSNKALLPAKGFDAITIPERDLLLQLFHMKVMGVEATNQPVQEEAS